MDYCIMLDVGGTNIKAGILIRQGECFGEVEQYPSCAKESADAIFSNLVSVILRKKRRMSASDRLRGICMAFPGPFDYSNGVSLMRNLEKYDAIYGLSVPDLLRVRLANEDPCTDYLRVPFYFQHDVEAFALGVQACSLHGHAGKIMNVVLGTGTGSAYVMEGRIVDERTDGVPGHGWIYSLPFQDATVDDYLSARGLTALSMKHLGRELDGKMLAQLAREGDSSAIEVFKEFGKNLADVLRPLLVSFQPDVLVFGGQIAKSFSMFGKELEMFCEADRITVMVECDTSLRIFQGMYHGLAGHAGDR